MKWDSCFFLDLIDRMAGDARNQNEAFGNLRKTFASEENIDEVDSQFTPRCRRHEKLFSSQNLSPVGLPSAGIDDHLPNDIREDLRSMVEQLVPDLCLLDDEPRQLTIGESGSLCTRVRDERFDALGTRFYCTVHDILTSHGEFWVQRELSADNERKFHHFTEILSVFADSYASVNEVYIGQLVALHYQSSWHRGLVVSKSEGTTLSKPASARIRLVDDGSSLYVNVAQLKWLPEQFYFFPFKVMTSVRPHCSRS